jgi:hypothetical protein
MSSELLRTPKQTWPWPDALVAAPGHHSVLLENQRLRVVHTHILPGHMPPYPAAWGLLWAQFQAVVTI